MSKKVNSIIGRISSFEQEGKNFRITLKDRNENENSGIVTSSEDILHYFQSCLTMEYPENFFIADEKVNNFVFYLNKDGYITAMQHLIVAQYIEVKKS